MRLYPSLPCVRHPHHTASIRLRQLAAAHRRMTHGVMGTGNSQCPLSASTFIVVQTAYHCLIDLIVTISFAVAPLLTTVVSLCLVASLGPSEYAHKLVVLLLVIPASWTLSRCRASALIYKTFFLIVWPIQMTFFPLSLVRSISPGGQVSLRVSTDSFILFLVLSFYIVGVPMWRVMSRAPNLLTIVRARSTSGVDFQTVHALDYRWTFCYNCWFFTYGALQDNGRVLEIIVWQIDYYMCRSVLLALTSTPNDEHEQELVKHNLFIIVRALTVVAHCMPFFDDCDALSSTDKNAAAIACVAALFIASHHIDPTFWKGFLRSTAAQCCLQLHCCFQKRYQRASLERSGHDMAVVPTFGTERDEETQQLGKAHPSSGSGVVA